MSQIDHKSLIGKEDLSIQETTEETAETFDRKTSTGGSITLTKIPDLWGYTSAIRMGDVISKGPWVDVRAYGAKGDGTTNDATSIQAAIDSAATTGGTILFPSGTYRINSKLTLSNSNVHLRGMSDGGSTIKWLGSDYATMIQAGDGTNLMYGIGMDNLCLDANSKASTFLDVINFQHGHFRNLSCKNWKGESTVSPGWALKVRATGGLDTIFTHFDRCTFDSPIGDYAYGATIGPNNQNCNEVTFTCCQWLISSVAGAEGLRFGFADHIFFFGCQVWTWPIINTIAGVVVAPPAAGSGFPANISFIGSPIHGGIKYDITDGAYADDKIFPSLTFLPYYTSDNQIIPPYDFEGNFQVISDLVTGYTDDGIQLNMQRGNIQYVASAATIQINSPVVYIGGTDTITNIKNLTAAGMKGFFQRNAGGGNYVNGATRVTLIPMDGDVTLDTGGNIKESIRLMQYRAYDFIWTTFDGGTTGFWYRVN